MRKQIVTLAVNDYAPEITALTFPLMRTYAAKIGAEFHVIRERKFPGWPAAMEKFQCYELALKQGEGWTIFLDADALVHPDCFDFTDHVPKDTIVHHGVDRSTIRFAADRFFRRDGRFIAPGNWFTAASDWCIEAWDMPTDLTLIDVVGRITPTVGEIKNGVDREHLVDDYIVARNTAKYGLKATTFIDLCGRLGLQATYFWHQYRMPNRAKVEAMRNVLSGWGLL